MKKRRLPIETGRQILESMAHSLDMDYATYYMAWDCREEPDESAVLYATKDVVFGMRVKAFWSGGPFERTWRGNESLLWLNTQGKDLNLAEEARKKLDINSTFDISRNLPALMKTLDWEAENRKRPYQVRPENASIVKFGRYMGHQLDKRNLTPEWRYYDFASPNDIWLAKRSVLEKFFEEKEEKFQKHNIPYNLPRISFFASTKTQFFEFPFAGDIIDKLIVGAYWCSYIWQDSYRHFRFIDTNSPSKRRDKTYDDKPVPAPYNFDNLEQLETHLRNSPLQTGLNRSIISHLLE